DEASLQAATNYPIDDAESTAVATIWSTLWTMVREASLPATHFVRAVAKLSNDVEDVSMHARLLEQAVSAVKEFTPAYKRKRMTIELGTALMDALVTLDPGSDRQRSAARALTQLGQGTEALAAELTFLLAGDETSELSPGLEIDDEMKWLLLISLASLGRIDDARLADELSISHTATNELYYRTAIAALPDLKRHSTLWTQIYDGVDSQGAALTNAQVTASARGLAVHPDFLRELFPKLL